MWWRLLMVVLVWFGLGVDGASGADAAVGDLPLPIGDVANPLAAVVVAGLLRGWTPTLRILHVHEEGAPPAAVVPTPERRREPR